MNRRWRIAQAGEIRWWRRYLGRRDPAEYIAQKRAYWRRVLERSGLRPAPGERVLDAGCGPAGIFLILEQQQVDALDPLLDQYVRHLAVFQPADWPWVRFQSGTLEAFRTNLVYDSAFCMNAINHVADLELALNRLAASVRPGGNLVVSVDVHRSGWLKHLFRLLPGDILHPQQQGLEDYLRLMEAQGCRIRAVHPLRQGRIFDYVMIVASKEEARPENRNE